MKFSKKTINELIEMGTGNELDGVMFLEETDWYVVHKGEAKEYIFLYEDKFYQVYEQREGSPFSDWHYYSEYWGDQVDADEVEMIEVTTYEWVRVKK